MSDKRGVCSALVGRPEGKRLLGRPRHRWEGNIKMGLRTWNGDVWTEFLWLRKRIGDGPL
jgi:hypothetical protein